MVEPFDRDEETKENNFAMEMTEIEEGSTAINSKNSRSNTNINNSLIIRNRENVIIKSIPATAHH